MLCGLCVSTSVTAAGLGARLERLYEAYNREDSAADPVQIVRRYAKPEDQEIVGFCAAALAFGRVATVLASIQTLFRIIGPHPAEYVRRFDPGAGDWRMIWPTGTSSS